MSTAGKCSLASGTGRVLIRNQSEVLPLNRALRFSIGSNFPQLVSDQKGPSHSREGV